jgi:transcriptional regulator with XRE-family HTH domain
MTQQELAEAIGMAQPGIVRIERGTVVPRADTLIKLLAATGHQLVVETTPPPVDEEPIRRRLAMSVPARSRTALGRLARNHRAGPLHVLRRLRRFGVPFVLVGELAEVVHGRPATLGRTVEICHPDTDVARERLDLALADLQASEQRLDLRTVRATEAGDDYAVLARNASKLPVDAGIMVPVAAVEDLVRARAARATPEDAEVAAILRAAALLDADPDRWPRR